MKDNFLLLLDCAPDDAIPDSPAEQCGVSYVYGPSLPLVGTPLRSGGLLMFKDDTFVRIRASLYLNGYSVASGDGALSFDVALSPFCQVRAAALRNDAPQTLDTSGLRAFRVSIVSHSAAATFATQGEEADAERARWVADFARCVRTLTASLFPPFAPRTEPLVHAPWTRTRLLAGYLVMRAPHGADLVYCELHSHTEFGALFAGYEDERCRARVLALTVTADMSLVQMAGVDCSCFSLGGERFSARSAAETFLWVRSLLNLRMKLRHPPSRREVGELASYRAAILECASQVPAVARQPLEPLLPRKARQRGGDEALEESCNATVLPGDQKQV